MPTISGAVAVVVLDDHDRALMVREGSGQERWRLPGGQLREDETPTETAIREALEETGAHVELDHLVAFYELSGEITGVRFVFAGHFSDGQEPTLPRADEIAGLAWFSRDALPERMTAVAPWGIRDATEGHRGSIRKIDV